MLRFASFTRVSTDEQEKRGESLATQAKQIDAAVDALNGTITARFGGGAEHGTTGFDRAQYDAMLAAALGKPRPFDAVMVQHEDRFSRDDTSAIADLERLWEAGVKFFVLGTEKNIGDASTRLHLGMSALIGAYHARVQAYKSVTNRIERARRGIPAGGGLPFGRTYDRKSNTWHVVLDKQRMIADVAARYLGGETLPDLATEYGTTDTQLGRLLRTRCGPTWTQTFAAPRLGIAETAIETAVPPLLDAATIAAVCARLDHRRVKVRHPAAQDRVYLLSSRIYCSHCGYGYIGQARSKDGRLYYRHLYDYKRRPRPQPCPLGRPEPWIRAELLEQAVVRDLLSLLGNPAALAAAVQAALPDTSSETGKRDNLEARLAEVDRETANLTRAIRKGVLQDDEAAADMEKLRDRKAKLREALDRVNDVLADVPSAEELQRWSARFHLDEERLYYVKTENARALLAAAFSPGARLADGKPAGVYVSASIGVKPRQYSYQLRGRFLPDAVRLLGTRY
jgi:DNA invertase Pin-like site-specific DNA recombinase